MRLSHRFPGEFLFVRSLTVLFLTVAAVLTAWGGNAIAQEEKAELPSDPPIVVLSLSSFERALGGMDVAFASAGRPEMSDTVGGLLGRANDLKGFGRDKPVGLMVFLNGITPDPVAFVPGRQCRRLAEDDFTDRRADEAY